MLPRASWHDTRRVTVCLLSHSLVIGEDCLYTSRDHYKFTTKFSTFNLTTRPSTIVRARTSAIELASFSLKEASSRVSLLIHLHARKINPCTLFAVVDNVKNNETRGTVFLKYNEGNYFFNILLPNDTFLILVKIQPIKGTVHLV
jgi:hypothetical protein